MFGEKHVYDKGYARGSLQPQLGRLEFVWFMTGGDPLHLCKRGICFRVIEKTSSGVWWRRGSVEQRYPGRAGTGVSRSARLWVQYTHAGYGVLRQSGNYPDARDVPSAFDAPHNEDLPGIVRGEWFMRSERFINPPRSPNTFLTNHINLLYEWINYWKHLL